MTGPSPVDRGKSGSKIHALSDRRRKPAKLHADKAYEQTDLRRWVRNRGIKVRIARKGIESSQKLGKHRWVIK